MNGDVLIHTGCYIHYMCCLTSVIPRVYPDSGVPDAGARCPWALSRDNKHAPGVALGGPVPAGLLPGPL